MRGLTLMTVVVGLAVSLACGGGGLPSAPEKTLTEPWSSLGMGTIGGKVIFSDETNVSIFYEKVELKHKVDDAVKLMKDAGCSEQMSMAEVEGAYTWTCTKDGATFGVSGVTNDEAQILSLVTY